MEIIENYYNQTPNVDNKDSTLTLLNPIDLSADKSSQSIDPKPLAMVDSSILQNVIDLLCTILKKTSADKQAEEFSKIIDVFPKLL